LPSASSRCCTLFLERKYSAVEIVFIRHTETAQEVDEKTFFHDPQSGGTLVMPALQLTQKVIDTRFAGPDWNIYIAQASDGDCGEEDAQRCAAICRPSSCRGCATSPTSTFHQATGRVVQPPSDLWQCYESVADPGFAMRKVHDRRDIWPVFRELFARKEATA